MINNVTQNSIAYQLLNSLPPPISPLLPPSLNPLVPLNLQPLNPILPWLRHVGVRPLAAMCAHMPSHPKHGALGLPAPAANYPRVPQVVPHGDSVATRESLGTLSSFLRLPTVIVPDAPLFLLLPPLPTLLPPAPTPLPLLLPCLPRLLVVNL